MLHRRKKQSRRAQRRHGCHDTWLDATVPHFPVPIMNVHAVAAQLIRRGVGCAHVVANGAIHALLVYEWKTSAGGSSVCPNISSLRLSVIPRTVAQAPKSGVLLTGPQIQDDCHIGWTSLAKPAVNISGVVTKDCLFVALLLSHERLWWSGVVSGLVEGIRSVYAQSVLWARTLFLSCIGSGLL